MSHNSKTYYLLTILILASYVQLKGQIVITVNTPSNNITSLEKFWDLTIINSTNTRYLVFLEAELSNQNDNIINAKTQQFELQPGTSKFTEQSFENNIRYEYSGSAKNFNNEQLPAGKYHLCIIIKKVPEDLSLYMNCLDFTIEENKPEYKRVDSIRSRLGKYLPQMSGTSELFTNLNNSTPTVNNLSQNYLWWSLNPTFTISGFPIGAMMILSTDNSPVKQNPNIISFYFDADNYKENLKKKASSRIEGDKNIKEYKNDEAKINEYKNVNKILKNPQVKSELEQLDTVKKIEAELKDTSVISDKKKYDSLKGEYNKYKPLLYKRQGYERLLLKKLNLEKSISDSSNKDLKYLEKATDKNFDPVAETESLLTDSLKKSNPEKYDSINRLLKKYKKIEKKARPLIKTADNLEKGDITELRNGLTDSLLKKDPDKYDSLNRKLKTYKTTYNNLTTYQNLFKGDVDANKVLKDSNLNKIVRVSKYDKYSKYGQYRKYDKSSLEDPDKLKSTLLGMGLMNNFQKYLFCIKSLSIGTSVPVFTEMTLSGMPVKGFSFEARERKFYLVFTTGKIQQSVMTGNIYSSAYKRTTTSAGLGYGDKEKSHIFVYFLDFKDKEGKSNLTDSLQIYNPPRENRIIGSQIRYLFFKDKLVVESELAGSWIKRKTIIDNEEIVSIDSTRYNYPGKTGWFKSILFQKTTDAGVVVDYAYSLKAKYSFFHDNTQVSAGIKRIGPQYQSFGVPYLINDMVSYELRVTQDLYRKRIILSAYAAEKMDNLNEFKPLSTKAIKLGFDAMINIPKWPYLKLSITPYAFRNDSQHFYINLYSINSGYSYKTGKINNNTTVTYVSQVAVSSEPGTNFSNSIYNINHIMDFRQKFSVSGGLSYMTGNYNDSIITSVTTNLACGFKIFKKFGVTIGGSYNFGKKEQKTGYYLELKYPFLKYFSVSIRGDKTAYDNYYFNEPVPSHKEFILRISLKARW